MRANETQWENFCWLCWKETESLVGLWCQPGGAGVHPQETWGQCLWARPLQRTPESGGERMRRWVPDPPVPQLLPLNFSLIGAKKSLLFVWVDLQLKDINPYSPFSVFLHKILKPNPHPSDIIQTCCSCLLGDSRHNSQLHLWLTALNLYYRMVS